MTINTYLFDAEGRDRTVPLDSAVVEAIDDRQLLWVEVSGADGTGFDHAARLLHVPPALIARLRNADGALRLGHQRPRVDLYTDCFHLNIQAVQERESGGVPLTGGSRPEEEKTPPARPPIPWTVFRVVDVHFIVFANVVLTVHGDSVAFLESFDHRIKGDTNLGTLNGPAFLGAVLNWHINGFFRALETIEKEVDRIDDAALGLRRIREERDLLGEMVKARRRLALVRRALLPHREVYASLARPNFVPFVTPEATETLHLVYDRMERAVEATENARELILGSFDIFTTQTTLRTNEAVKVLTMISALLLPAGVIANLSLLFLRTPVYDLGKPGFWDVLLGIIGLDIALFLIARRRTWF